MDQVPPLLLLTVQIIRRLLYPCSQDEPILPYLCRLCFSKVIQQAASGGPPIRFFNSANFALDVARYQVTEAVGEYPTVQDILTGMGEMLSRMHWISGCTWRL